MPLPQDSRQVLNDSANFGPTTTSIAGYTTALSREKLARFYEDAMPKAGWQKKQNLFFQKGNDFAAITVIPQNDRAGRTRFSIARGQIPTEEMVRASQKDKPDVLNFMPVYPGAKQNLLWDTPMGMVASYQTDDAASEVLFFYKAKMLNYGWALADEIPLQREAVSGGIDEKNCPECVAKLKQQLPPGAALPQKLTGESVRSRLTFKKGASETCVVSVFAFSLGPQSVAGKEFIPASSMTQISVNYNDLSRKAP